jgi:starvation-inducible DNA-binding protein
VTKRENSEHGFLASKSLTDDLQAVLVDLVELHVQGKQAHWNVVGHNFRDLHLQLDEIIDAGREFSDAVAERMRALHASVDGRTNTVAATTTLEQFPDGEIDTATVIDLITARLDAVVATARRVHDNVDEQDPTSSDLLHQIIARLEQFSWMVSAENRVPAKRTK